MSGWVAWVAQVMPGIPWLFFGGFRMAFAIRYLVPYRVTFQGVDLGSGRRVSNNLYWKSGVQTTTPPAYGGGILGAGSTLTTLTNAAGRWINFIARLNHNYSFVNSFMVALIGKRFGTPLYPILGWVPGSPVKVVSGSPHGYVTGQTVAIAGVTIPVLLNGIWTITVTSPTEFELNGSNSASGWSGDGTFQKASGPYEFLTADLETQTQASPGGVAGDSLPLFCTSSIRRLNGGIGRNFRSRFSCSPMSEVDVVDGGFTSTQQGLMVTALAALFNQFQNGGSDVTGSAVMLSTVVSNKLAFATLSPFTQANTWSQLATSFVQQRNTGSMVRRKPRLTQVIT